MTHALTFLAQQRKQLLAFEDPSKDPALTPQQLHQLTQWAHTYHLTTPFNPNRTTHWQALKARVDTWPMGLILAQAALESGWGTSRFAQQGHNLFGLWCYQPGCGLIPLHRKTGQRHEVKRFPNTHACIRAYLHTLNTHPAYQHLRALRAQMRAQQRPLNSLKLAEALSPYAEIRHVYTERIIQILQQHHLTP